MFMLSYIIVHTFVDMANIGDILNPSHIVMRFIRSHIASRVDARANHWELHFNNLSACQDQRAKTASDRSFFIEQMFGQAMT